MGQPKKQQLVRALHLPPSTITVLFLQWGGRKLCVKIIQLWYVIMEKELALVGRVGELHKDITCGAGSKAARSAASAAEAETHKAAGNELFKAGSFEEAVKEYSSAIELNPDSPVYYSNRAMAYLQVGLQFCCQEYVLAALSCACRVTASMLAALLWSALI